MQDIENEPRRVAWQEQVSDHWVIHSLHKCPLSSCYERDAVLRVRESHCEMAESSGCQGKQTWPKDVLSGKGVAHRARGQHQQSLPRVREV